MVPFAASAVRIVVVERRSFFGFLGGGDQSRDPGPLWARVASRTPTFPRPRWVCPRATYASCFVDFHFHHPLLNTPILFAVFIRPRSTAALSNCSWPRCPAAEPSSSFAFASSRSRRQIPSSLLPWHHASRITVPRCEMRAHRASCFIFIVHPLIEGRRSKGPSVLHSLTYIPSATRVVVPASVAEKLNALQVGEFILEAVVGIFNVFFQRQRQEDALP